MRRLIRHMLPMLFQHAKCPKAQNIGIPRWGFPCLMPGLRMVVPSGSIFLMASSRAWRSGSASVHFGLPRAFGWSARTNAQIWMQLYPHAMPGTVSSINLTSRTRRASSKSLLRAGVTTFYTIQSFIVKLILLRCVRVVLSMHTGCTTSREMKRSKRKTPARHWTPYLSSQFSGKLYLFHSI